MLQGTKHINPVWDALPETTVDEFLRTWTHELENWTAGSTDAIIESITHYDALRDAWGLLDERSREARRQVIETIAANLRNEEAEQVVAPNRSLPPSLNSTSSVRGSEDF